MKKEELEGKTILLNLSGRGDKDMMQAQDILTENFK
jgi:tryptophan synthase beta chain